MEWQLQEQNWKIHKYVIKQHATEQPVGQIRNQKKNQEVSWDKWKRKYNIPKLMGYSKSTSKGEVHSNKYLSSRHKKNLKYTT